jgi:hypothetical protein
VKKDTKMRRLILIFLVVSVVLIGITEAACLSMYGYYVPESAEGKLRSKLNGKCELINDSDQFYFYDSSPLIAKVLYPTTSTWYIKGQGLVPRWSKLHKMIEAKRDSLLKTMPVVF